VDGSPGTRRGSAAGDGGGAARARGPVSGGPRLLAVSDLHVGHPRNREVVAGLAPGRPGDWLIVAGDVGEDMAGIEWALQLLSARFAQVIWVPGNHELWTRGKDRVPLRGQARYDYLVGLCRGLRIATPEDPFPVWDGPGGPATVAPLFLLYDYTFLPDGTATKAAGLACARQTGVICTDEQGAPRGLRRRGAADPGQPLSAGPRADPGAALSAVRDVVRHHRDRGLAHRVRGRRRGVRAPAHPAHDLA